MKDKLQILYRFAVVIMIIYIGGAACTPHRDFVTIYHGGTIITMAADNTAEALAVKGSIIVAVGDSSEVFGKWGSKANSVINLNGQALLPGFVSSHSHFFPYILQRQWQDISAVNNFFWPDWEPVRTDSAAMHIIKTTAKASDDTTWLSFYAYDPSRQGHRVQFNTKSLDSASTTRPIFVYNNSGHFAYVNTKGLDKLKCTASRKTNCIKVTQGSQASKGVLQDDQVSTASALILLSQFSIKPGDLEEKIVEVMEDIEKIVSELREDAEIFARRGYTTVADAGVPLSLLEFIYVPLSLDPENPLRFVPLPLGRSCVKEDSLGNFNTEDCTKMYEIGKRHSPTLTVGPIKFWADGSPQGYTGWMLEPYTNPPYWNNDKSWKGSGADFIKISPKIKAALRDNFDVAVHLNGDASAQAVIDLFEHAQASDQMRSKDPRHQFIHLPFVMADTSLHHLERMKNIGAAPTFLINDLYYWGKVEYYTIFGHDRTESIYPLKKAKDMNMHFSMHSDAPITPPDPLWSIWVAVTRTTQNWGDSAAVSPLGPGQAITIEDGLKAYTINAAHQFRLEKDRGSLEVGKLADLVWLTKNPLSFEATPDSLCSIEVVATVRGGRQHQWPKSHVGNPACEP